MNTTLLETRTAKRTRTKTAAQTAAQTDKQRLLEALLAVQEHPEWDDPEWVACVGCVRCRCGMCSQ